jgi:hypothetical protein
MDTPYTSLKTDPMFNRLQELTKRVKTLENDKDEIKQELLFINRKITRHLSNNKKD